MKVSAILWDYDGTLVDTINKNYAINKELFATIRPQVSESEWPLALSSLEAYKKASDQAVNWRDLYFNYIKIIMKYL